MIIKYFKNLTNMGKGRYVVAAFGLSFLLLALYLGGLSSQVITGEFSFGFFTCVFHAIASGTGRRMALLAGVVLAVIGFLVVTRGRRAGTEDERNFLQSNEGTYGTAGFMTKAERKGVLQSDSDAKDVDGIIFGTDLEDKKIISLPIDSYLNRNVAVCGSQGSMKSRAFVRNMMLQCVKRGESMVVTDPKSEMYEDMAGYLINMGYTVRQFNLISLVNSDGWDCLGEVEDGDMDVFVDTVIRNTTDKFDHFYDNVEMDLLKALCLYVVNEYPKGKRTLTEAYKLLIDKSVETLDSIFDALPVEHPARGPYRLFSKAEKVKGNAVLGLGTRLQIMQNKLIQKVTSHAEIDLSLPGRERCAYFCITSDQDSTYDVLSCLFVSFLFIKLVRLADRQPERRLPITMHMILDEFPNIGVVADFKKKLATARSRGIGIDVIFQNLPQLQNRYPETEWEELLGGCDMAIFLGCNDLTTADYFSKRAGEITVGVESIRKNYQTIRVTDYVPDYTTSSSLGKRMLMLPDEILRFPSEQTLVFIRGQKVLKLNKMDYTKHPEAGRLTPMKAGDHTPEWRKREEDGQQERREDVWEPSEPSQWEDEPLSINADVKKNGLGGKGRIEKVEDLFRQ